METVLQPYSNRRDTSKLPDRSVHSTTLLTFLKIELNFGRKNIHRETTFSPIKLAKIKLCAVMVLVKVPPHTA